MKKKTCTACADCVYESKDYKVAEKKARENNPSLFAKQDALNEEKRKQRHKDKIISGILMAVGVVGGLMLAVIAGAMAYGLVSQNMELLTSNTLRIATGVSMIADIAFVLGTTWHNEKVSVFWSNMATRDYELYKEERKEFAKVGYELP